MAVHIHNPNFLHTHQLRSSLTSASASPASYHFTRYSPAKHPGFICKSNNKDDYLIDAPVSAGDGFSFSGGKYSDQPSPSDEWLKQGKWVKAHRVGGSGEEAKDPIFGLTMGSSSQASKDVFRWFCVESGKVDSPPVILIHGFPSQSYSYRKALPVLSKNYRAIAFDWLGFGFSDKPQAGYGFNYTLDGSSGFALNAISRAMKKELKGYTEEMRTSLMDKDWKIPTTVCWGQRDKWLSYQGVEEFCKSSGHDLVELPMAGHHVQEDCGEEIGGLISRIISKSALI
ncbi:hypothetical protein F2Q70_00027147 [Brassica cretica]|uniref:AB hydrolase-1 domain-containing protein n=1 Tax=Brassica cretica TaxID=69181 RepID=A0A8S9L7A1_BRACR|nr:hypothetical protein F2Q70_00027147 [Brassica cretica]